MARPKLSITLVIVALVFAVIVLIFVTFSAIPSSSPLDDGTTIPTSSPTHTISPTLSPNQTLNPTYIPNEQNYSNNGYIYTTGVKIFGGELHGNAIQWTSIYAGESTNTSFFVQSTSNVPVTISFIVTNWSPPGIGSFLSLSWDYNGLPIYPNQTILVTLTLTSQSSDGFINYLINDNVTTYSFNLQITSTKY